MVFSLDGSFHGNLTCPICGKETDYFCLQFEGKISYFNCHRCFLPRNHTFRLQRNTFRKDTVVTKGPLKHLSGQKIADMLSNLVLFANGDEFVVFGTEHNWTHICELWELSCFKVLIMRHNINLMHQERNVTKSIVMMCMNFMDKTKDSIKTTKHLAVICDRPSLRTEWKGSQVTCYILSEI